MRLGYVGTPRSLGCRSNHRFRLASYSEQRLTETIEANLACLEQILRFNQAHKFDFYRISSDLIPFASHPICKVDWGRRFRQTFERIGAFITASDIRISMHPGQFVLLNSPDRAVLEQSLAELAYHARLLKLLGLERNAKIQIHAGGVYGDKPRSMERFCSRYGALDPMIRDRLVVENDDYRFNLRDCLDIHEVTGIPLVFDNLHHECFNRGETIHEAMRLAERTWKTEDGPFMVDYSSQQPERRLGVHADHLDPTHFRRFLSETAGINFDMMIEIRDKEASALTALNILQARSRTRQY